jgi:cytochrome bd ubiquinol oxidase subunit I
MHVEPLDLPMLYGRIAIATAASSHTLFATFIVGSAFLGAATETIAYLRSHAQFERLARLIAFALIFSTAAISFLGVTLVFFLNIFWPHFWSTLFRVMFWPLLLEASFFLGEAVFAYSWYYSWDRMGGDRRSKRWHLGLGWSAAACSYIAMLMIDIVASYMLTPRPPEPFSQALFNPTMAYLHVHRLVGNFVWTGFAVAGLCAVGWIKARSMDDAVFYRWGATVCLVVGFGGLLIMPAIGYQYLLQVRYTEPQAFQALMLGGRSWLFDLVALLYSLLVLLASWYTWKIVRRAAPEDSASRLVLPWSLGLLIVAGGLFAMPYHLQHVPLVARLTDAAVNPLGKMQPFKYLAISALVFFGLTNWIVLSRSFSTPWAAWRQSTDARADRTGPGLIFAMCLCAVLTMLSMGWVRESARAYNGYLIYGVMKLSDEQKTYGTAPSPAHPAKQQR